MFNHNIALNISKFLKIHEAINFLKIFCKDKFDVYALDVNTNMVIPEYCRNAECTCSNTNTNILIKIIHTIKKGLSSYGNNIYFYDKVANSPDISMYKDLIVYSKTLPSYINMYIDRKSNIMVKYDYIIYLTDKELVNVNKMLLSKEELCFSVEFSKKTMTVKKQNEKQNFRVKIHRVKKKYDKYPPATSYNTKFFPNLSSMCIVPFDEIYLLVKNNDHLLIKLLSHQIDEVVLFRINCTQ